MRYQEDSDDEFFLSQMQPEVQLRVGDAARLFVERVEIKLEPGSSRFVFLRLSTRPLPLNNVNKKGGRGGFFTCLLL